MNTIDLDKVYCLDDKVVPRKIVDEMILVPIKNSVAEMENLYSVNEVGARVYELVDGKRTGREICAAIVEDFEVSQEQAETDVAGFLEQLLSIGGIKERSEPA
jgi:hypothetical protein